MQENVDDGHFALRVLPGAAVLACAAAGAWAQEASYTNPLPVTADGQPVESCADPSVVEDADGAGWVMYCTTDPLSGADRTAAESLRLRLVPTFSSEDLVNWTYRGDAFDRAIATNTPAPPAWAAEEGLLWAPEGAVIGGRHYLLFGVTDVQDEVSGEPACPSDGAIGYAVGETAQGPWTPAETPLIAPRRNGEGCDFFWTYDPEVVQTADGRRFIAYGSYYGGIEMRELAVAEDGSLSADPATVVPIAIPNRYEGAEVVFHDGAWWLFASASNCCNGPQTGYAVFVGRAEEPTGPFLDRAGASFLEARVGGTPVIVQNGNRWVGPGHNTVLQDRAGDWWTLYHAVEEAAPYFEGDVGFTRRPVLMDRLDWVEGWPVVRGGPSDEPRSAPAVTPEPAGAEMPEPQAAMRPGPVIPTASDEFDAPSLGADWTWLREPEGVVMEEGVLSVPILDTDLYEARNDAPVLLRAAPEGDFMLDTKVAIDLPPEGCCQNFVQAGLVIHADDDNYLKLVAVSIWETRQTEFAREIGPFPAGFPMYGSSVVGPPGEDWTWLRLLVRRDEAGDTVTAFTSPDGESWVQGATWTHDLGEEARIGLLAMGGSGNFTARFDHLRAFSVED
jgi:arabinan endo-1,5-alpha-L-arabinosidase